MSYKAYVVKINNRCDLGMWQEILEKTYFSSFIVGAAEDNYKKTHLMLTVDSSLFIKHITEDLEYSSCLYDFHKNVTMLEDYNLIKTKNGYKIKNWNYEKFDVLDTELFNVLHDHLNGDFWNPLMNLLAIHTVNESFDKAIEEIEKSFSELFTEQLAAADNKFQVNYRKSSDCWQVHVSRFENGLYMVKKVYPLMTHHELEIMWKTLAEIKQLNNK